MQKLAFVVIFLISVTYANLPNSFLNDKSPLTQFVLRNQGEHSKLNFPNPIIQPFAKSQGEYSTFKVTEGGTELTQESILDHENNLLITLVPAYNGYDGGKYVFDGDSDLMMIVREITKSCTVQKSLLGGDIKSTFRGYRTFHAAARGIDTPIHIIKKPFKIYEGYRLRHQELPKKFQSLCPPDFLAFTAHTIDIENASPRNPHMLSENLQTAADFFDYKPPTYTNSRNEFSQEHLSRSKKCIYSHKNETWESDQCFHVKFDCNPEAIGKQTCPNAGYNFNCSEDGVGGCHFKLVPECIDANTGVKEYGCLFCIMYSYHRCQPCCESKDCGGFMPKCLKVF